MVLILNNKQLFNKIHIADSFYKKLKGLLGKSSLDNQEGLLLKNCSSVHCYFMKFAIDVIYLSRNMVVIDKETIEPGKTGKLVKNAKHILEVNKNASAAIEIGDKLIIKDIKDIKETMNEGRILEQKEGVIWTPH